jgi:hypothetical protein
MNHFIMNNLHTVSPYKPERNFVVEKALKQWMTQNSKLWYVHDIALVKLAEPVDFDVNKVNLICLPIFEKQTLKDSVKMWIASWGATTYVAEADLLQVARVSVLPIDRCKDHFAGDITSDKICTFGIDVGGGEGGPLQFEEGGSEDKRHLYGLISYWGEPGTKKPAVYTRISSYIDFILDNIAPNTDKDNLV